MGVMGVMATRGRGPNWELVAGLRALLNDPADCQCGNIELYEGHDRYALIERVIEALSTPPDEREMFPVAGGGRIPRAVAEVAYIAYAAKYGRSQSLDRLGERGGFHSEELDALLPDWRERIAPITPPPGREAVLRNLRAEMIEFSVLPIINDRAYAISATDFDAKLLGGPFPPESPSVPNGGDSGRFTPPAEREAVRAYERCFALLKAMVFAYDTHDDMDFLRAERNARKALGFKLADADDERATEGVLEANGGLDDVLPLPDPAALRAEGEGGAR